MYLERRNRELIEWVKENYLKNCTDETSKEYIAFSQIIDSLKERDDLFYTLAGVMMYVDKWLDGDELKLDEIERSALAYKKAFEAIAEIKNEDSDTAYWDYYLTHPKSTDSKRIVRKKELVHKYREIILRDTDIKRNFDLIGPLDLVFGRFVDLWFLDIIDEYLFGD